MPSDYPFFADLSLPDQLRLAAFEGEGLLPPELREAIQRAADALEAIRWAIDAHLSAEDPVRGQIARHGACACRKFSRAPLETIGRAIDAYPPRVEARLGPTGGRRR